MSKIFDLDSPVMRTLSTIADLMILNLITFLFCIPVITAGASLTAAHYVALKMVRNEENYIIRGFWKSFKQNFKQATLIWLIVLVAIVLIAGDLYIIFASDIELHFIIVGLILVATVLVFFGMMYVFPVLAKFDNTIFRTIKNAFLFSIMNLPKSILMIGVYAIPVVITFTEWRIFPLVMLLGLSVPIYLSAMLYNKLFRKFEALVQPEEGSEGENEGEDERIFHDEITIHNDTVTKDDTVE